MKFNIQDRIVLDEMVDAFTNEMLKQHAEYEKKGKNPIITSTYWLHMIQEVQHKIDQFDAYEDVRESGVTNMFDWRTVSDYSGLNKQDIMTIMQNYGELSKKYGN